MPTFLQPVWTSKRCFLNELLLWVAVQRLPVIDPVKDKDIRETFEVGRFDGHEIDYGGLPLSPRRSSATRLAFRSALVCSFGRSVSLSAGLL